MKAYACPLPEPTYAGCYPASGFDRELYQQIETTFLADLKAHMVGMGYTKSLTGHVISFPMADSCARYMVAEGSTTVLVHLPLGDAWQADPRTLRGTTKADVLDQIERNKFLDELWAKKLAEKQAS